MNKEVAKANELLRAGKIRVKLYQRFDDGPISLKATLPPKPGSGKTSPHQQTIALGIRPTAAGIRRAVQEAKRVDLLLANQEFSWSEWLGEEVERGPRAGEVIAKWERHFFLEKGETVTTRNTWKKDYLAVYNQIPDDFELNESGILELIAEHSEPNTRTRKRWCQAMKKLVDYAELPVQVDRIQKLKGSYGKPGTIKPRTIPTDEEILEYWDGLDDPTAKWVWGLMATFGVRNFECWFVDVQDLLNGGYTIRVLRSKTRRERIARALPRIWIDRMELRCPIPLKQPDPNKTHGELGDAVTHMFTNKGLPGPYNLRHAWRERAIRYGIDPSVAARSLGHSVNLSQAVYTAWMGEKTAEEAFERAEELALARDLLPRDPQSPVGSNGKSDVWSLVN